MNENPSRVHGDSGKTVDLGHSHEVEGVRPNGLCESWIKGVPFHFFWIPTKMSR
jgi:hypothetical protein